MQQVMIGEGSRAVLLLPALGGAGLGDTMQST